MIPTVTTDRTPNAPTDDNTPRFFLDDTYDAGTDDGDWWLDLGLVDLPNSMAV